MRIFSKLPGEDRVWLLATIQIAVASALATTFDDNIYLTAFFGEVDRKFRPAHVVTGELIGVSFLIAIALLGASLGVLFPRNIVGLLGVLPIAIGVSSLSGRVQELLQNDSNEQRIPLRNERSTVKRVTPGFVSHRLTLWQLLKDRQTYGVSVVTIANGSNNLSIYIPLFASLGVSQLIIVVPTIYMAVFCWLGLSYGLTRTPGLSLVLNRHAKTILPFVLIWLGYRILADSGSLELLINAS
jgi:cadmium resistance protein CadD (predicted permease)